MTIYPEQKKMMGGVAVHALIGVSLIVSGFMSWSWSVQQIPVVTRETLDYQLRSDGRPFWAWQPAPYSRSLFWQGFFQVGMGIGTIGLAIYKVRSLAVDGVLPSLADLDSSFESSESGDSSESRPTGTGWTVTVVNPVQTPSSILSDALPTPKTTRLPAPPAGEPEPAVAQGAGKPQPPSTSSLEGGEIPAALPLRGSRAEALIASSRLMGLSPPPELLSRVETASPPRQDSEVLPGFPPPPVEGLPADPNAPTPEEKARFELLLQQYEVVDLHKIMASCQTSLIAAAATRAGKTLNFRAAMREIRVQSPEAIFRILDAKNRPWMGLEKMPESQRVVFVPNQTNKYRPLVEQAARTAHDLEARTMLSDAEVKEVKRNRPIFLVLDDYYHLAEMGPVTLGRQIMTKVFGHLSYIVTLGAEFGVYCVFLTHSYNVESLGFGDAKIRQSLSFFTFGRTSVDERGVLRGGYESVSGALSDHNITKDRGTRQALIEDFSRIVVSATRFHRSLCFTSVGRGMVGFCPEIDPDLDIPVFYQPPTPPPPPTPGEDLRQTFSAPTPNNRIPLPELGGSRPPQQPLPEAFSRAEIRLISPLSG